MPRYYFDLTNSHQQYVDGEGEDLHSDRDARVCARAMLIENLSKSSDAGEAVQVTIRDRTGHRFSAKLLIQME